MAWGKRKQEQQELLVATTNLPQSPGHFFYQKLNQLLGEAQLDEFVEGLCRPYCAAKLGRPGIPLGVYFRMLFVGYFEGLDSQRAIAWRWGGWRSVPFDRAVYSENLSRPQRTSPLKNATMANQQSKILALTQPVAQVRPARRRPLLFQRAATRSIGLGSGGYPTPHENQPSSTGF